MGSLPLLCPNNELAALRRWGNKVRYAMCAGGGRVVSGYATSVALWNRRLAFRAQHLAVQQPKVGPWGQT
jgi:hypothetical protein